VQQKVPYSITSSARSRIDVGRVMPSAFAALRFREMEFIGLIDRQISRLRAPENLGDVRGGALIHQGYVNAVGHQAACLHICPKDEHCGQLKSDGELSNLSTMRCE